MSDLAGPAERELNLFRRLRYASRDLDDFISSNDSFHNDTNSSVSFLLHLSLYFFDDFLISFLVFAWSACGGEYTVSSSN